MDSERELLELAAKAVGRRLWIDTNGRFWGNSEPWNPLTDDGDALRLAVALHLFVIVEGDQSDDPKRRTLVGHRSIGSKCQDHGKDPYAATRRAIVRAAAEIGRGMVGPNASLSGGRGPSA